MKGTSTMKRALFLILVFIVFPVITMAVIFELAQMKSTSDLSAQDANVTSLKADHDFYMMSQTEHLKKGMELCKGNPSMDQLFQARHHLVSIPVEAPEYSEAMSLLGQIEIAVRPAGKPGSNHR